MAIDYRKDDYSLSLKFLSFIILVFVINTHSDTNLFYSIITLTNISDWPK